MVSLVYATAHLAALQINGLPVPPYPNNNPDPTDVQYDVDFGVSSTKFILGVSILHFLVWLAQAILCTSCELAPILAGTQGRVPRWCPQSRFKDTGTPGLANMLGTLATVKDFLEWGVVLLTILLIECARREYMRAMQIQQDMLRGVGAGVDFGGPSRGVEFGGTNSKMPDVQAVEMSTIEISGPWPTSLGGSEEQRQRQENSGRGDDGRVRQELAGYQAEWQKEQDRTQPQQGDQLPQRARSGSGAQGRTGGPNETRLPSIPERPGGSVPGFKDAYRGNGAARGPDTGSATGLKRTGTLNHMYESRV